MWEYSPESDCWTRKADFPGNVKDYGATFAGAFGIAKFGYILSAGESPALWQLNPKLNQWTKKANFPGLGRKNAVGFTIGKNGYIGTGKRLVDGKNVFLKDFWQYNPETNQWLKQADFGGVGNSNAFGIGTKTKGYVKTGQSDPNELPLHHTDFWEFDPCK
ncbi:MAG: hypothetical protein ACOH2A_15890 [Sphingobacteriaceae bacterium]